MVRLILSRILSGKKRAIIGNALCSNDNHSALPKTEIINDSQLLAVLASSPWAMMAEQSK